MPLQTGLHHLLPAVWSCQSDVAQAVMLKLWLGACIGSERAAKMRLLPPGPAVATDAGLMSTTQAACDAECEALCSQEYDCPKACPWYIAPPRRVSCAAADVAPCCLRLPAGNTASSSADRLCCCSTAAHRRHRPSLPRHPHHRLGSPRLQPPPRRRPLPTHRRCRRRLVRPPLHLHCHLHPQPRPHLHCCLRLYHRPPLRLTKAPPTAPMASTRPPAVGALALASVRASLLALPLGQWLQVGVRADTI